jgi:hypothetical protein
MLLAVFEIFVCILALSVNNFVNATVLKRQQDKKHVMKWSFVVTLNKVS